MTDVFPQDKWDRGADVGHEHKWQLQQRLYFVKIGFAVKITNQAIPQALSSTSFITDEFKMAFVCHILHWTSNGHKGKMAYHTKEKIMALKSNIYVN